MSNVPEPTAAEIAWIADRFMQLRDVRLSKLGKGAKLCAEEIDAILAQALKDGEKHAREVKERAEHQALMDKRKEDERARAEGKPTLRATLGEIIEKAAKR